MFLPLLAAALASTWYGLDWSLDRFRELSGGQRFVDMQPWLTPGELLAQAGAWSPETRQFYLWWSLFDYAWPFLTFTAMLFIAAWLFRFLGPRWQPAFAWLVAAAYLTVLMDWGENLGFAMLALGVADRPLWLARVAVALHAAKLACNLLFNVGFWIVAGGALTARLRA